MMKYNEINNENNTSTNGLFSESASVISFGDFGPAIYTWWTVGNSFKEFGVETPIFVLEKTREQHTGQTTRTSTQTRWHQAFDPRW